MGESNDLRLVREWRESDFSLGEASAKSDKKELTSQDLVEGHERVHERVRDFVVYITTS